MERESKWQRGVETVGARTARTVTGKKTEPKTSTEAIITVDILRKKRIRRDKTNSRCPPPPWPGRWPGTRVLCRSGRFDDSRVRQTRRSASLRYTRPHRYSGRGGSSTCTSRCTVALWEATRARILTLEQLHSCIICCASSASIKTTHAKTDCYWGQLLHNA